jgi:acyl carrier protein
VEILYQVKRIVAKTMKVPIEQLTANTKLEDLSGMSMDVVEIILQLEEKFEIYIPIEVGDASPMSASQTTGANSLEFKFETIGKIAKVVKSLIDAKARGRTVL